jgi:hypothetical protein
MFTNLDIFPYLTDHLFDRVLNFFLFRYYFITKYSTILFIVNLIKYGVFNKQSKKQCIIEEFSKIVAQGRQTIDHETASKYSYNHNNGRILFFSSIFIRKSWI